MEQLKTEKIIKEEIEKFIISQREVKQTFTSVGSLKCLLYGPMPSLHSIVIKVGRWGERLFSRFIEEIDGFDMLPTGLVPLGSDGLKKKGKKERKDIDLAFRSPREKVIYYMEMKANIELDTEKLPATITKMKEIKEYLKKEYPEYTLNFYLLNWSLYSKEEYDGSKKHIAKITSFEKEGVPVFFPENLFNLLGVSCSKELYNSLMRDFGDKTKEIKSEVSL